MIFIKSNKGFTLLELIIVIGILSFVIAVIVPMINTNLSNTKIKQITTKLAKDFADMESGFNNYVMDKNTYPSHASNLLQDTNFVPFYLMPPPAPEGFDTTYGTNGYLMFSKTDVAPKGYYICAKVDVANGSDIKYIALKNLLTQVSPQKFFYNTSCPSASNLSTDPTTNTTLYVTYWMMRMN